jgi:erythromycin esterase
MKFLTTSIILSVFLFSNLQAQVRNPEMVAFLNEHLVKIELGNNDQSFDNLKFLDQYVADKKIIGLGEGTHGTREIFLYKDRMIRYLVSKHNVRYILMESDMAGLEKLNDYVLSEQQADLKHVMSASGIFGIYYTQEVVDMIEWLKGFNKGKTYAQKVKLKGMDMQTPNHIFKTILHTELFVNSLSVKGKANLLAYEGLVNANQTTFSKEQISNLTAISKELKVILKTVGDPEVLERLTLDLQLYDQFISLQNVHPYIYSYQRDKNMAENVSYIARHTKPEDKVVVWAHNGHISNHLLIKHKAMGMRLKNEFGDKYYSLAFGVADGYSRLYEIADPQRKFKSTKLPEVSNPNSVEHLLKSISAENFFMQITGTDFKGPIEDFFTKPRLMIAIGPIISNEPTQNYSVVILKKAYDGFVFFRNTTAATEVK